ncbi:MAG: DUF488 domain-containing protein [Pseudomonadota bacterium]
MIATIGYERSELEDFIGTLQRAEVEVLVDIRERAQSRRKGFSKTALAQRLEKAGISYVHIRELGDPKPGREAARRGDMVSFKRIFNEVLKTEAAKKAMLKLRQLSQDNNICLMCYERNHKECHRKIVSDRLETIMGTKTRHLGVQQIEPISKRGRRMLHTSESAAA